MNIPSTFCLLTIAACMAATAYSQDPSGLADFPGISSMIEVLEQGGMANQLAAPNMCDGSGPSPLSPECQAELKTFPETVKKLVALDLAGASEEIPRFCGACNPDEVASHLDNIRSNYNEADKDLSCGGSIVPELGDGQYVDVLKVLLSAACIKKDDKLCFGPDVLVQSLGQSGLLDTIGDVDFNNLSPTTITSLMGQVTNGNVCGVLKDGGCCSGMVLDILGALTELTCLNTPIINSAVSVVRSICPDTPATCADFQMADYTMPQSCPSGGFRGLTTAMENTTPVDDSSYGGCSIDACPKNDCELFMCLPTS